MTPINIKFDHDETMSTNLRFDIYSRHLIKPHQDREWQPMSLTIRFDNDETMSINMRVDNHETMLVLGFLPFVLHSFSKFESGFRDGLRCCFEGTLISPLRVCLQLRLLRTRPVLREFCLDHTSVKKMLYNNLRLFMHTFRNRSILKHAIRMALLSAVSFYQPEHDNDKVMSINNRICDNEVMSTNIKFENDEIMSINIRYDNKEVMSINTDLMIIRSC